MLSIDDSDEIRENELMLEEEDDIELTKELDFGQTSPPLFGDSPMKTFLVEGKSATGVSNAPPTLCATTEVATAQLSIVGDFYAPSLLEASQSVSQWISAGFSPKTAGEASEPAAKCSERDCQAQRQSIACAIEELTTMTSEMQQFIQAFEAKHSINKN
ncbi:uncharacterized protein LOC131208040 [Anopheles bellator]|uniref:uncharacterized protein LOC131208040 n=1 Tax=Anopheles bellator TaxID=139047 RepID=UPI0026470E20|nr:uncharacterized protein LOC131208040 [Anopheles bellator]